MNLTADETQTLLNALSAAYGPGYSQDQKLAQLQVKLSVHLEVMRRRENRILGRELGEIAKAVNKPRPWEI